ncbi:AfsR/SARP family transcriptional regulator [Streptomyces sp. NPDC044989]|uniref:AfsR/SARP family transcriptional regulator n=1 Tax=Streptomyces sp. NPDC044989 TaxID=3154336 RepID=UPI0033CCD6FE
MVEISVEQQQGMLVNQGGIVEIQLLGAVLLRSESGTIRLQSKSARALLGLLAWRCNEHVSDDRAISEIWGDELPEHPQDALYTCASRVRRALKFKHAVGHRPLCRRGGGYSLSIDPENVDLHRFRRLVQRARSATYENDDLTAIGFYDSAQALWAGTFVSDIHSPWAAGARHTATQEWLSAETERASTALRLKRHTEVIPQLYQLVARFPLDEAIASMLMIALHRSGRQGEALECFGRLRSELLQQLGDAPGPDVQALHHKILRRQTVPHSL